MTKIKPERAWTWDEWMRGRYRRRMLGKQVAPAVIRRAESKDDAPLREANGGERGAEFASDEELKEIAIRLGGPTDF